MTTNLGARSAHRLGMAMLGLLWLGLTNLATPALAGVQDEVETDPIACWWATDKTTVQVGERFTLTLTCGVVETSRVKVAADFSALDPAAITLAPFEVVGGSRFRDLQAPPWRYAQFKYSLRLIGEAYFGKDVDIPSVKVTYRIHSTIGGGSEGRDQTYLLPALPVRVMSLVPKKAGDIRDASHETFGDIESRQFRATTELVLSGVFFAFAVVTLGLAGVRVWGRSRERAGGAARPVGALAILGGCLRSARRLRTEVARDGWTPDLVARALVVFRIAGALAAGRRLAQTVVDSSVAPREGQLALPRGWLGTKRTLVSAPTTPRTAGTQSDNAIALTGMHARLAEIQSVLTVLGAARYGRDGHFDPPALDRALEEGTGAIRRLRLAILWPSRTAARLGRSAAALKERAWSR